MDRSLPPLADVENEAGRLLSALRADNVIARLLGGLGIAQHRHGPVPDSLRRSYGDIDVVVRRGHQGRLKSSLEVLGYTPNERFNSLQGESRLLFYDEPNRRQVDVFVGAFRMCHDLDLDARLELHGASLSPADLLLTKLQVVELNEKDLLDAITLVHQHETGVDDARDELTLPRLQEVTSRDWGWFTTFMDNLSLLGPAAAERLPPEDATMVARRVDTIATSLDAAPKSLRWKARARVGRRVAWYQLPEEVNAGTKSS